VGFAEGHNFQKGAECAGHVLNPYGC